MRKKSVWMGSLIIAFLCFIILFHIIDDMEFCGLQVMSVDRLAEMTENMYFVDEPENTDELIELDGQPIPYDKSSNTFYVSQSAKIAEYAGNFRAVGDNCEIYIERDEALTDKTEAIAQGHQFKLWFLTEDSYTTANLIYIGLPIVSIKMTKTDISTAYTQGSMVIHDPDDTDISGTSVKQSAIVGKQNENTGTITIKLYKETYEEERNLSLLELGKHTSWKLYPVSDKDDTSVRIMLAAYVWNAVCADESLQRSMEMAEVIVDGKYVGLYYLTPKVGKGFLELTEDDRVYGCEDTLEDGMQIFEVIGDEDTLENREPLEEYLAMLSDFSEDDLSRIDRDNYINYHVYLQAVCGVQNSQEKYYVIVKKRGTAYFYQRWPEKSDYVWGLYPSKIGWQTLTAAENIMVDVTYEMIAKQNPSFVESTVERWNELRADVLSTDTLVQEAYTYEKKLMDSGYIVREGKQDTYNASCNTLKDMIIRRMNYLDEYYNGTGQ